MAAAAGAGGGAGAAGFDLVGCSQRCIERAVETEGLKILLLDDATRDAVSMCYSFTDLLKKDLYIVDALGDGARKRQGHLKGIVYVRPTEANVDAICEELRQPLYAEYHLFFTNALTEAQLGQLAEADDHEVVREVNEAFADYFPLHPYAFSVDLGVPLLAGAGASSAAVQRAADALASVMLSLRRRPAVRFQGNSQGCQGLAQALAKRVAGDPSLFDFRRSGDAVMLIVDRCDDVVTPLLTQWTYEAMLHEEFSLTKYKTTVPQNDSSEEMNLVPLFDSFFAKHLHSNWGELCVAVKGVVDGFKAKTDVRVEGSESIENLKAFMEKMPELRKESVMMGKHITIAAALSKAIKARGLMDVSELEQTIACSNTQRENLEELLAFIENDMIDTADIVRLVLLYIVRWERSKDAQVARVKEALAAKRTLTTEQERALERVLTYGGAARRASDLFDDKKLTSLLRQAVKGVQDVENVYTQHIPLLKKTVQALARGKLPHDAFPYSQSSAFGATQKPKDWKPKEIIVFVVGGMTFEETKAMKELMSEGDGSLKVVIGGTDVLRARDVVRALGNP